MAIREVSLPARFSQKFSSVVTITANGDGSTAFSTTEYTESTEMVTMMTAFCHG